jgi:hypothetical protein
MVMRAGTARSGIVALVLALVPGVAFAGWAPGVAATAGGTFAISGVPDEGGFAFSLAPMWYVGDGISAGFMLSADDMGTELGRLTDVNDGSDLGATALRQSWVSSASFRMDAEWGSIDSWMPFVSGTWGWYRIIDDEGFGGERVKDRNSVGWSAGGGIRWQIAEGQALGTSMRYHRLFNDRIGRFMSWSLDWSFR